MKEALLIIDMVNKLDFPEGKKLLSQARSVAKNILKLKTRLKKRKVPVIYVNDNFGHWKSNWEDIYLDCTDPKFPGAEISRMLRPDHDDYFIVKPKHSGFYSTSLDVLLSQLKISKLYITGMAGNICVLFTVNDAYMRGFDIHVPKNCIASNTVSDNRFVIKQLTEVFKIKTAPT